MNLVKCMGVITLLCDFNMHDPFLCFLQSSFVQECSSDISTEWLQYRYGIHSPGLPANLHSSSRYVAIYLFT